MKHYLLKSIIGKYICNCCQLKYCHVDTILAIEGESAIVTIILKPMYDCLYYIFSEISWVTNSRGIHKINKFKILKEVEIDEFSA